MLSHHFVLIAFEITVMIFHENNFHFDPAHLAAEKYMVPNCFVQKVR